MVINRRRFSETTIVFRPLILQQNKKKTKWLQLKQGKFEFTWVLKFKHSLRKLFAVKALSK